MIEVIDLRKVRQDCSDLDELRMLLAQLVGQPFRFFRVSYGEELRLHLGELQGYSSPKLSGKTEGSYDLGTRASSWIVYSAPRSSLVASDDFCGRPPETESRSQQVDIKEVETGGFITPCSLVTRAGADRSTHGFTLQLGFSDGSTVLVRPTPDEHEATEVCDWEVFTPHGRTLRVGPGPRWSYLDSTRKPSD